MAQRVVGGERALRSLEAQVRFYESEMRPKTTKALREAVARANLDAATKALARGDVDGAVQALYSRESASALADALTMAGVRVLLASVRRTLLNDVPKSIRPALTLTSVRGAPSQYTIRALQSIVTNRVTPIVRGSEEAMRSLLTIGLLDGENPRVVARWGREAIGFTKNDAKLVESFERQLVEDPMRALSRTLRSGRFDPQLKRWIAGTDTPTKAEIAQHVAAYESGLRSWRAETFTRTTTLDALRTGQLAAWGDAAEANGIDASELVKTWITTLDGRERDEHHAAHGTTVGMDELFPVDGGVMVPGEGVYNCRCAFTVRVLPANRAQLRAFAASRRAIAAERLRSVDAA